MENISSKHVSPNAVLKHYANEIDFQVLQETFNNLQMANFAMDIGGSLVKIVYQTTKQFKRKIPVIEEVSYSYVDSDAVSRRLCFIKFETRHLAQCLNFIVEHIVPVSFMNKDKESNPHLKVTGGGAIKYKELLSSKLNVIIDKEDEMESLTRGCIFLLKNIPDEVFYFEEETGPNFSSVCLMNPFPFLLVNIGSGISILKVESEQMFTRVGGTSIGGGTFWGIGSLIAHGKSFDELLEMASCGDYKNVDMLVKDIYGGSNEILNLSEDLIASSFGLAAKAGVIFSKEDAMSSLLLTISNNIGQLSCLYAQLCEVDRIIFGGFFTRGHIQTMKIISSSVKYWSKNKVRALFLRHEGYLGAIGAFLKSFGVSAESMDSQKHIEAYNIMNSSWLENYAGSATFSNIRDDFNADIDKKVSENIMSKSKHNSLISKSLEDLSISSKTIVGFETRELERTDDRLEVFKLLFSPQTYVPDSWDLTSDTEARLYWLNCFKSNVPIETVYQSQKYQSETSRSRSEQYKENYLRYLTDLETSPTMHGILTVRCLLDAHQNFLRKYGFTDPYWIQKMKENEFAMKMFPSKLLNLKLMDWDTRQFQVVIGLLAGNVFDWGSKEVVLLMSKAKDGVIDFTEAVNKLQPRPWLIDCYDKWFTKLSSKPPNEPIYQSVLIFCDNSGFDFIIGVVPFALECLSRGSIVILSANSEPSINDVTFSEIVILVKNLAALSPELDLALKNEKLLLVPNGQVSPCLDLRFVSRGLNYAIDSSKVDLVVIEGMARAIHTNLLANFTCDSLKIAVIKNAWLANRLGGELFSVVFKYEQFNVKDKLLLT